MRLGILKKLGIFILCSITKMSRSRFGRVPIYKNSAQVRKMSGRWVHPPMKTASSMPCFGSPDEKQYSGNVQYLQDRYARGKPVSGGGCASIAKFPAERLLNFTIEGWRGSSLLIGPSLRGQSSLREKVGGVNKGNQLRWVPWTPRPMLTVVVFCGDCL